MSHPRIWGLLGHRTGDNNQLLALCEEIGSAFETRTLEYNQMRLLEGMHPASLASLTSSSRRRLEPPWPDLLVTIGRRSVPVARAIRQRSRGRTKLVLIGHPRTDPSDFDLIITTRQYPIPKHPNVLVVPMALSRQKPPPPPSHEESGWLARLPRPHLLFAIGGSTKYFDLTPKGMAAAARRLSRRADSLGGSLIVSGSPRTEASVLDAVEKSLTAPHALVRGAGPRFPLLMADAEEIFVTGDSLSMLSEAILTGRPVGMIEPTINAAGRLWLGNGRANGIGMGKRRDMRRIWADLKARGLAGSIERPVAGMAENATAVAADAVRALLGRD